MILKIMLITLVLIALAFAGIGIKMFLVKGGKFEKKCSTVDPKTGKRLGCTCGADESGSSCENKK